MLWYEDEVKRLEADISQLNYLPGLIFYGSSSIRLWDSLEDDFEDYSPLNLGFGGSTLAACAWFFQRIYKNLQPRSIIIYAGDNDLGDGRHPEEVFVFFKELISEIRLKYGDIPVGYISVKPSISRWDILEHIRHTNKLIEEEIACMGDSTYFINVHDSMTDKAGYPNREFLDPDGLHMNAKGYALWKEKIMGDAEDGKLKLYKNDAA